MRTYFLFGQEAVEIYDNEGIKKLVKAYEKNNVTYDTFEWVDGVTKPHDILAAFVGYDDYSLISKKDFDLL